RRNIGRRCARRCGEGRGDEGEGRRNRRKDESECATETQRHREEQISNFEFEILCASVSLWRSLYVFGAAYRRSTACTASVPFNTSGTFAPAAHRSSTVAG